jgi:hypothetical protein
VYVNPLFGSGKKREVEKEGEQRKKNEISELYCVVLYHLIVSTLSPLFLLPSLLPASLSNLYRIISSVNVVTVRLSGEVCTLHTAENLHSRTEGLRSMLQVTGCVILYDL